MDGWIHDFCLSHFAKQNWVCELKQKGISQYIVWNTEGDQSFRLSKDWHVSQFVKLDGRVNKISGDSIPIGIQPVLVQ